MTDRLDQLHALLASEPGDAFLQYAIALEYRSMARPNDALRAFAALLAIRPDYLPAYYPAAELHLQCGQTTEALALIEAGIQLATAVNDPKTARELRLLGEDAE